MLDYFAEPLEPCKDELMVAWAEDGFRLELFWLGRKVGYRFYDSGKLIFEGNDYRPSPLHAVDGPEAVEELLVFLSLRPGDVEDDYFADYTEDQLEWVEYFGETLAQYAERVT